MCSSNFVALITDLHFVLVFQSCTNKTQQLLIVDVPGFASARHKQCSHYLQQVSGDVELSDERNDTVAGNYC